MLYFKRNEVRHVHTQEEIALYTLPCEVGVCGPYILFNGLDISDDEDVGGGVICEVCVRIP